HQAREVGRRDALLAEIEAARARDVTVRDTPIAELHAQQAREVGRRDAMLAELSALREKEMADHNAVLVELRTQIATLREELARAIASQEPIVGGRRHDLAPATRGW